MVSRSNCPSQTSIDADGGPIREAAALRHLKSHSASVYTTDAVQNRWGAQVHMFKTDRNHTSGSERNDGSDSMFSFGDWERVCAPCCAGRCSFMITSAYSFDSQAHGSLFKRIQF
jgi:hypothetical protein